MPGLVKRTVRTTQPQTAVGVDWNNPITHTLAQGVLGGSGGRMLVGNFRLINHITAPTSRGLATKTATSQFLAATPSIASDTASFTLFLLEVVTDTAESNASVFKLGRTATTASAQVSSSGFSNLVPGDISAVVNLTGTAAILGSSSNVLAVGSVYSAALRFRNGVSVDLTVNGRLDSTYPTTALGASGGYGFYGTRSASTTPNCQSILSLVFSSALSDAEVKSLSDNPWQIFQPDVSYLDAIYQERLTISPDESRWMGSRGRSTEVSEVIQKHTSTRTSQPQGPVEINWANPITRGIEACLNPGSSLQDLKMGGPWATVGSVSPRIFGLYGVKAGTSGPTLNGVQGSLALTLGKALYDVVPWRHTHVLVADIYGRAAESQNGSVFSLRGAINSQSMLELRIVGTSLRLRVVNYGLDVVVQNITSTNLVNATFVICVEPSLVRLFINGHLMVAQVTSGDPNASGARTRAVLFGDTYFDGTFTTRGAAYNYTAWSRALSDAEIKSLSDNPWQIFKPHQKTLVYERQVPKIDSPKPKVKAMKVVKHVRTKQPQGPVRIDLSNRYGNLHAFVVPGVGELVRGLPLRRGTGVSSSISPYGVTSKHDGTTNGAIRLTQNGGFGSLVGTTTSWTLSLLVYIDATPLTQYVIGDFDININNASVYIYKSGGFWSFNIRTSANVEVTRSINNATPGWHTLNLVYSPSQVITCYADKLSAVSDTSASSTLAPGIDACIGTFGTSGLSDFTGKIAYVAIHKFAFSEADVKTFNANPWQIFQPESKTVWVDA